MAWLHIVGWVQAQRIGRGLGLILYAALPRRRRMAADNMMRASDADSPEHAGRLVFALFQNLGMLAAEVGMIEVVKRRGLFRTLIDVEHSERITEALARGRGVILSIGHLGNWETASLAFCEQFQSLASVYRPLDYPPLDRLLLRIRTAAGMTMVAKSEAIPRLVRILKNKGCVALLTDQDARADGIFVSFFGRLASTLSTPAALALRYGTPIVPAYVARIGSRLKLHYDAPLWPESFAGDPDARRAITQELATRQEGFIRAYPDQWFWLHRRWKTQPS
jgi:KDO2-lipid IV(A) lauroyltransferase